MDSRDKPDPYGEWVLLLGTSQVPDGPPHAIDEELLVRRERLGRMS